MAIITRNRTIPKPLKNHPRTGTVYNRLQMKTVKLSKGTMSRFPQPTDSKELPRNRKPNGNGSPYVSSCPVDLWNRPNIAIGFWKTSRCKLLYKYHWISITFIHNYSHLLLSLLNYSLNYIINYFIFQLFPNYIIIWKLSISSCQHS